MSAPVRGLGEVPTALSEVPGVEVRHLRRAEGAELKVVDVDPDGSTPFHTHPHSHEAVIVAGLGTLRLEDGEHSLSSGDVLSIGPNEPHAVGRAPEGLRFVCMDRFSQ